MMGLCPEPCLWKSIYSGWTRNCPVHNPEINPETVITIVGFVGAIMLLLDVVVIK